MLSINQNKGFFMTFENGFTISVQFGTVSDCSARDIEKKYGFESEFGVWESENAEIAIWDKNLAQFNFDSDTFKGWVSADEVVVWINRTMNATDIETL